MAKISEPSRSSRKRHSGSEIHCPYLACPHVGDWALVHRIVAGIKPGECIDHINGDEHDNRPENLRIVTHRENSQNMERHGEGKLPGCSKRKEHSVWPWESHIYANGKPVHLGYFATEQEAHDVYKLACWLYK